MDIKVLHLEQGSWAYFFSLVKRKIMIISSLHHLLKREAYSV